MIPGEMDAVVKMSGGKESVIKKMHKRCPNLTKCVFYPKSGHWIQQEEADSVNNEILDWLKGLDLNEVRPVTGISRL